MGDLNLVKMASLTARRFRCPQAQQNIIQKNGGLNGPRLGHNALEAQSSGQGFILGLGFLKAAPVNLFCACHFSLLLFEEKSVITLAMVRSLALCVS